MTMVTLKKQMIKSLASLTLLNDSENKHIVLVTSSGIIKGKVRSFNDAKDLSECPSSDYLLTLANLVADNYKSENSIDGPLEGDDGFIYLEDVEIINGALATTTHLDNLITFFDQIIGITVTK